MENKVIDKMTESINKILGEGLNTQNIDLLSKLVDIYKDVKEVENMNYGEYGEYGARRGRSGYGNYGEGSYGEYGRGRYGRQGRDSRYRGDDELDRMYGEYGRYQESRRYGAGEETDKSFHYMVKSLEDFIKVLYEEAETPQQKQQLMQALQNSMR